MEGAAIVLKLGEESLVQSLLKVIVLTGGYASLGWASTRCAGKAALEKCTKWS